MVSSSGRARAEGRTDRRSLQRLGDRSAQQQRRGRRSLCGAQHERHLEQSRVRPLHETLRLREVTAVRPLLKVLRLPMTPPAWGARSHSGGLQDRTLRKEDVDENPYVCAPAAHAWFYGLQHANDRGRPRLAVWISPPTKNRPTRAHPRPSPKCSISETWFRIGSTPRPIAIPTWSMHGGSLSTPVVRRGFPTTELGSRRSMARRATFFSR